MASRRAHGHPRHRCRRQPDRGVLPPRRRLRHLRPDAGGPDRHLGRGLRGTPPHGSQRRSRPRRRLRGPEPRPHLLHGPPGPPGGGTHPRLRLRGATRKRCCVGRIRAGECLRPPLPCRESSSKTVWNVSAMALTYRMHDLGLLTDRQYRSACTEPSRRGCRKAEPEGNGGCLRQAHRAVSGMCRPIGAAYVDAVSEYAALGRGELREAARAVMAATSGRR